MNISYANSAAQATTAHDALTCGILGPDDLCASCRAALGLRDGPGFHDPARPWPWEAAADSRRRRRGERLAAFVRAHGDALRPVVLDLLADDFAELAFAIAKEIASAR